MDSDLNQYRAYDDEPLNGSIDFCSGPIPIATVNISHAEQTDLFSPFNTHEYIGCHYSRNNNEVGISTNRGLLKVPGLLMCFGWVNPVQCTPVRRIDAQLHICPGGVYEFEFANRVWGPNIGPNGLALIRTPKPTLSP